MLMFYLSIIENEINKSKFSDIYNNYSVIMYKCAYSVLHNKYDSEDAVHEVFLSLAKNFDIVSKNSINNDDLKRYLITAVKNRSIDILRKNKNQPIEYNEPDFDFNDSYSEDILDKIIIRENMNNVINIILSLDDKYLEVLYANLVLELSIDEIVKLSGLKKDTVKKRLYRGKIILRNKIESEGLI